MARLRTDRKLMPIVAQFVLLKLDVDRPEWREWSKQYRPAGTSLPFLFVIRADGKMLGSSSGAITGGQLPVYLSRHLGASGKILSPAQGAALRKLVEQAGQAWQAGRRPEAVRLTATLRKLGTPGKLGSFAAPAIAADKMIASWLGEVDAALAEIDSKLQADPLGALIEWFELEESLRSLAPAKSKLAAKSKSLRKQEELQDIWKPARAIAKAALQLQQGKGRVSATASLEELIREHPDSPVAAEARKVLDQYADRASAVARSNSKKDHSASGNSPETKPPNHEFRTWRDSSGRYSVVARLERIEDGKVVLVRQNTGKEVAVPIDRLSDNDRRYLSKQRPRKEKTP